VSWCLMATKDHDISGPRSPCNLVARQRSPRPPSSSVAVRSTRLSRSVVPIASGGTGHGSVVAEREAFVGRLGTRREGSPGALREVMAVCEKSSRGSIPRSSSKLAPTSRKMTGDEVRAYGSDFRYQPVFVAGPWMRRPSWGRMAAFGIGSCLLSTIGRRVDQTGGGPGPRGSTAAWNHASAGLIRSIR
jgi:hypothetical protein